MHSRMLTVLAAAIIVTLSLMAGCAKKKVSMDQSTISQDKSQVEEVVVVEESSETAGQGAAGSSASEYGLSEQQGESSSSVAAMKGQEFADNLEVLKTRVHFDFDSYELKPEGKAVLQSKAELMKKYPRITMVIEGNCDDRGTEEYNLALGERRARSAYEFLIILGVAPERMSIVSFGEENPLDPANNETAWAMNRRDDFRINY